MKNKTPAVLFYYEDFLAGCAEMRMDERGMYITLLALQNAHGHMSRDYIERVVPEISEYVLSKFEQDSDGNWFNERMEKEIVRRISYSESRAKNRAKKDICETHEKDIKNISNSYEKHMETETYIYNSNNLNNPKNHKADKEIIKSIIDYLNNKATTAYKANSRVTKEKINARLNEGFTLDDFMAVIDTKCEEWLGTEFEKYLRPATLFGTKFESYLNQRNRQSVGFMGVD